MATTETIRYSDGSSISDGRAKFAWEEPVPQTPFFDGITFSVVRNFLSNFTEAEKSSLPIDPHSAASKESKLQLMDEILIARLKIKDNAALLSGTTFHDEDYTSWERLWMARASIQQELGDPDSEALKIMRMLCEQRRDKSNMSHPHNLAFMLLNKGDYVGAEKLELEAKPWLEGKLGMDAPQVMKAWRTLVQAVWKQGAGRREDAERLLGELGRVIEGMRGGTYGMYEQDERKYFKTMKEGLDEWDNEPSLWGCGNSWDNVDVGEEEVK